MPKPKTRPKPSKREQAKRIALLLAGTLAGFILCELALRLWTCFNAGSPRPLWAWFITGDYFCRPDPYLNHALPEGRSFMVTGMPPGISFCHYGQISSQGLNDDFVPSEKLPGERRILVMGDSFVEAKQLSRKRNFCERLEAKLAHGRDGVVRVINAGVESYSPLLEYLYFKRRLVYFHPDIVLVMLFSNDVNDDMEYLCLAQLDDRGIPVAVRPGQVEIQVHYPGRGPEQFRLQQAYRRALAAPSSWLARHSYLAGLAEHVVFGWGMDRAFPEVPVSDDFFVLDDDPRMRKQQEEGWAILTRHLRLLKAEVDKAGATLLLSLAPLDRQVYGNASGRGQFSVRNPTLADHEHAAAIAKQLGVEYIDLLGPLRKAGKGLYLAGDGHWSAKGHRAVADALYPRLRAALAALDKKPN